MSIWDQIVKNKSKVQQRTRLGLLKQNRKKSANFIRRGQIWKLIDDIDNPFRQVLYLENNERKPHERVITETLASRKRGFGTPEQFHNPVIYEYKAIVSCDPLCGRDNFFCSPGCADEMQQYKEWLASPL